MLDSGPTSTSPIRTAVGAKNADGSTFGRFPRYSMIVACSIESDVLMHRHNTPLRGVKAIPHPKPGDANYGTMNYAYAGKTGHIHEVVTLNGRELAKVGFDDKKIVY